jgi:alpha-beta hydrolase superfamily lysophospholipase
MPSIIQSGRTRFGDIVSEFWMPRKVSTKAIILCDGCPGVPSKHKLGEFLARKGYWVFHIRYRGTWESGGEFLKYEPNEDISLVARELSRGFVEMWSGVTYVLDIRDITVIGASFGGTAALLASLDEHIDRAVALAPVVDFQYKKEGESFEEFLRQIQEGFGGAYRAPKKNFTKLKHGKFYNPTRHTKEFNPKKILVIHAEDDHVVPVSPLRSFARRIRLPKSNLLLPKKGGHLSTSLLRDPKVWKKVSTFLKQTGA